MRIRFALIGAKGAVSFVVHDWEHGVPPTDAARRELEDGWLRQFGHPLYPLGVDIGMHSATPTEWTESMDCDLLPSGRCWYDGSGLRAIDIADEWRRRGRDEDFVWRYLLAHYTSVFYGGTVEES